MNPKKLANFIVDEIFDFSQKHKTTLVGLKERLTQQIPMVNPVREVGREQRRREKTVQYEQMYHSPGRRRTFDTSPNTERGDTIKRKMTEANTEITPCKSISSPMRKVGRKNDNEPFIHTKDDTLSRRKNSFEIVYCYSDYKTAMDSPSAGWNAKSATELHTKHRDQLSALLSDDPFTRGSLAKKKKLLQYIRNESVKNPNANYQPNGDKLWKRFQKLDSIEQLEYEPMEIENYHNNGNSLQIESAKVKESTTKAIRKRSNAFPWNLKVPSIIGASQRTLPKFRQHTEFGHSMRSRHVSWSHMPTYDNTDLVSGDLVEKKQKSMSTSDMVPLTPFDAFRLFKPKATSYWVGTEVRYNNAKSAIEVTIRQVGSLENLAARGNLSSLYVSVTVLQGTSKERVIPLCRKSSQNSSVQATQVLKFKITPYSAEHLRKLTVRFRLFQKGSTNHILAMDWKMNSNGTLASQDWTNILC